MKSLKVQFSVSQIKALLRKDVLIRWRQPWMSVVQFVWPCVLFLLIYTIRLKFGPKSIDNCQFPTRQLPSKNQVLPFFYSQICSIENKCLSTVEYEEYSKLEKAPLKPIIDVVNIFITDNSLYETVIDLPKSGNFITAVTNLVTNSHFNEIQESIGKVVAGVPFVEQMLGGEFNITKLFSDRATFVKGGNLLCGHPFPSTESIPLINDILYSEDFSEVNDDELKAMPTHYCKKLYLDVTSTNHGKLTWNQIKPIIHGKILYAPVTEDTNSIVKFSNTTFEEVNRLKNLANSLEELLRKLRTDKTFQEKFDSLIDLVKSPFVQSLVGDEIDVETVEVVMHRIRSDKNVYEIVQTVKNILECFSVDRFVPVDTATELHKMAFELNQQRLFYAAVYFNSTDSKEVSYKFHMDTDNTQPTVENRNRFWFPGPAGNMIEDLKYHRGFAQIKHSVDIGIIKHKKSELKRLGLITEKPTTTPKSLFSLVRVLNDDDDEEDDDDDWFTSVLDTNATNIGENKTTDSEGSLSSFISGIKDIADDGKSLPEDQVNDDEFTTYPPDSTVIAETLSDKDDEEEEENSTTPSGELVRRKRQGLFDLIQSITGGGKRSSDIYEVDDLKFFTKQFPYPAYVHDDFKTGIYLGQAIQVAFYVGLLAQIASCIRHRIWMRESRNTMIMRSMGLKPSSELTSWAITTFVELMMIFVAVTIILYTGGILMYTKWLFIIIFLIIFGICLISFCYMCSTFFTSATIGAVASAIFFLISFCPYIIVLLFDSKLNALQSFGINLSFTTAFSHAWSHIMRMELQQNGLTFSEAFRDGFRSEFSFGFGMIILDTILYAAIGYAYQYWKEDEFQFSDVQRDNLDPSVGATMKDVSKIYDNNKIAVSNISLTFPRDQVTCLLGRNGAGKSTIIKMLTGQVVPTSGRVILSEAMTQAGDYDNVGVCSQDNILIPNLTAREHLELYAKIKLKHGYASQITKTFRSLNFGMYEGYQASQLSGGYQRRLCVAIAFIGSPNVVILDEPCNGVDGKARKDIWDLIEKLRKGRAVVFATHFLDEAEYLSDAIVIMKNGEIIGKHSAESLANNFTENFTIRGQCRDNQTIDEIVRKLKEYLTNYTVMETSGSTDLKVEVAYDQKANRCPELLEYLQGLRNEGCIDDLVIESKNLEEVFRDLDNDSCCKRDAMTANGHQLGDTMKQVELEKEYGMDMVRDDPLKRCEAIRELMWKRLVHFSRNYRMLLCVLVLPAIFEIIAMWFVAYRLEDDFDKVLKLSRDLYPGTTEMMSLENPTEFTEDIYSRLKTRCVDEEEYCKEFANSKTAFYWILDTMPMYHEKRYGGLTFNNSLAMVWYNNKGYHAMMGWLNDLNSHVFQAEMNDSEYSITAYNEPWKLGSRELSTTSIVRQVGDSAMSFILLIAFSLVVAVASVYIVNERLKGEKLQQRLCGVDAATYWCVAFVWDFLVIIVAIVVCSIILLAFGMPVFVAKSNLWGFIVLALLYGFACIPAVHVMEKFFTDSSMAIVTIFSMNVIIPLFTMSFIILLGVIGDSQVWDDWRFFLNRAFLIFPQHALGDGLVEICKNFMVAEVFQRFDINSYKNPVTSDLLRPHFTSLIVLGILFTLLNILIESGALYRLKEMLSARYKLKFPEGEKKHLDELRIVSIQNSLKRNDKSGAYDEPSVKVDSLYKVYQRGQYAVRDVTFQVKSGECFGLLGKNGAGKSTIFKMLSGQIQPDSGSIIYLNKEISYCPQTNTLDALLTVKESIEFIGRLRRINDIPKLVSSILESFQLDAYRDVLVKNLSGGNRRKLNVATSCCGRTSVVLMDEPTSDMDPVTRAIVYRAIQDLIAEQRAIILTSHSISEIDEICHRIAVLKDGQMITCSSPESLKSQYGGFYNVAVFCDQSNVEAVEKEIHHRFPRCPDLQKYSHSIKFGLKIDKSNQVASKVAENGIDILPVSSTEPFTLADLFRSMNELRQQHSIRFTVTRCRLDTVFEKILDSSDYNARNRISNGSCPAAFGSLSSGYIHNGFVETETIT